MSDDATGAVAALHDPLRARMYRLVRDAGRPVNRIELAAGAGISPKLAAFHLDLMEERGLLVSHYARPPGRTGRGAGRTAKYYELSRDEIVVSLPERDYAWMGQLLARTVESHAA